MYWYIKEEDIEAALSLVQKDAIELFDFIRTTVDNPFIRDIFTSKNEIKGKMLKAFQCIERLFDLMSMVEKELQERGDFSEYLDDQPMHPKQSPPKPSMPPVPTSLETPTPTPTGHSVAKLPTSAKHRRFKITTPVAKKEGEQSESFARSLHDCLNKMK